jgi:hypothetical protein
MFLPWTSYDMTVLIYLNSDSSIGKLYGFIFLPERRHEFKMYENCFASTGELHGRSFLTKLFWLACRRKCRFVHACFRLVRPRAINLSIPCACSSWTTPTSVSVTPLSLSQLASELSPWDEPFNVRVKFGIVIGRLCFFCHARLRRTIEWYKQSCTLGTIMRVKIY